MPRLTWSFPVLLLASTTPVWGLAQPVAVSPGAADRPLLAVSGCPTFSWGAVPADAGLRLTVHAVGDDGGLASRPAFRADLPAGATSWTPPADRCLSPGTYAWIVRAIGEKRAEWPEPFLFAVAIEERVGAPTPIEEGTDRTGTRAGGPQALISVDFAEPLLSPAPLRPVGAAVVTPCGSFNDVEATDPFCAFIQQAITENLISQCSTGLFCPGNPVTRQQAARLLLRARHGSAGGVLTGDYPSPDLAAAFRLPQDCQDGQLVRWGGAEWQCGSVCGDGNQSVDEECDDGNTVTETSCPYGEVPPCQLCTGSCQLVDEFDGAFCGDGDVDDPFEVCDDGNNLACGTCNAACEVEQARFAVGYIYTVVGSQIGDSSGFQILDTVFAFDKNGNGVPPGAVEIDVADSDDPGVVRNKIVNAVEGADVAVSAAQGGPNQVALVAHRATSLSNQPVLEFVEDEFFWVDGMDGGAGGDCPAGVSCANDDDCASNSCFFGECE